MEGLAGFGGFGPGCLLGKRLEGLEGWQTVPLKAHRKLLLRPWPWGFAWGACWGSGLLGRVFGGFWRVWRVLEGVWGVWKVLEGLEGLEGVWRVWRVLERLEGGLANGTFGLRKRCGLGPGVPVGEVALALGCLLGTVFGGFGRFWRVWRVWKVLEGLERLRAGKRQL